MEPEQKRPRFKQPPPHFIFQNFFFVFSKYIKDTYKSIFINCRRLSSRTSSLFIFQNLFLRTGYGQVTDGLDRLEIQPVRNFFLYNHSIPFIS